MVQTTNPKKPTLNPGRPKPCMSDADLKALSDEHFERLVAVSKRILGCRDLACDAVQEALVRLWQLPERPRSPLAWLLQSVFLRSKHTQRCLRRRERHEDSFAATVVAMSVADATANLELAEFHEAFNEAARSLPRDYRKTFLLREVDGLDYREIAAATGVPVGTVRSRLSRARAQLQEILATTNLDGPERRSA